MKQPSAVQLCQWCVSLFSQDCAHSCVCPPPPQATKLKAQETHTSDKIVVKIFLFIEYLHKIKLTKKSAPAKANARKTQTPTVAKQFSYSTVNCTHMNGICVFTKFDIWVQQKNILFLLIEIKKSVLLIWTMRIIWHNQYSIFQEKKQTNYAILRENKNSQKTKTNCEIYKSFIKSL